MSLELVNTDPLKRKDGHSMADQLQTVSSWRVVVVTVIKELQIAKRYLPNLVGRFIDLGVRVLFFLMLSSIISIKSVVSPLGHTMAGRELMIFFQGALILFVFNSTALAAPVDAVNRDLYNGTLEYLYTHPISRFSYFVGTVIASAVVSLVIFLPVFAVLIVLARTSLVNILAVFGVCLMILVAVVSLGVMIASMALIWRQVGSLASILSILFETLAGAYFPIAALPNALKYISLVLPYTWGYDLIRYYSFGGRWATLFPVPVEWCALAFFAIVFTLSSCYLLAKAERQAKQQGLHLI